MTRAQDVLDYIDAQRALAERHSSYEAAIRHGYWQLTGVQRNYDYDKQSPHHLRAMTHELLPWKRDTAYAFADMLVDRAGDGTAWVSSPGAVEIAGP